MAENGKNVLPGDVLATAEEYLSGEGTYILDGNICSAIAGESQFDREEMVANVVPARGPAVPRVDDIVYGKINSVNPQMVSVDLLCIEGQDRQLATLQRGNLHVSNMEAGHTKKPRMLFKSMELVRARVIQDEPSIQLSTASQELGIVKAYCRRCRGILDIKGGGSVVRYLRDKRGAQDGRQLRTGIPH
ncbi:MAG: exosome complex RNA-binding protein Csl4 [Thermoplasmata archaeon]|nr:exosome complex RNA-binding protein Csl4 [Thermoplasmata archaeon]